MSNIIIPDESVIKAINDGGSLILDHNLNPISSKEIAKPEKKRTHKFSMPVGKGWVYYKFRTPGSDKYYVGWVNNRSIPQGIGATAIEYKTAFKMLYGEDAFNGIEKQAWGKISDTEQGEVIIETEEQLYNNLPNPNAEGVFENIQQQAEGNFNNINSTIQ
jgi:hypothetical protein